MICSVRELHAMDLGTHMHLMEEWNEDAGFVWGPATVILQGFYTRIHQEDGQGGLHIATYITNGEGDLREIITYTHHYQDGTRYFHVPQGERVDTSATHEEATRRAYDLSTNPNEFRDVDGGFE